jgi:hypothetical protein
MMTLLDENVTVKHGRAIKLTKDTLEKILDDIAAFQPLNGDKYRKNMEKPLQECVEDGRETYYVLHYITNRTSKKVLIWATMIPEYFHRRFDIPEGEKDGDFFPIIDRYDEEEFPKATF